VRVGCEAVRGQFVEQLRFGEEALRLAGELGEHE
jgi:hypothetical protein